MFKPNFLSISDENSYIECISKYLESDLRVQILKLLISVASVNQLNKRCNIRTSTGTFPMSPEPYGLDVCYGHRLDVCYRAWHAVVL